MGKLKTDRKIATRDDVRLLCDEFGFDLIATTAEQREALGLDRLAHKEE